MAQPAAQQAERRRLVPVDQAATVPDLARVVNQVREAIRRRDSAAVLEVTDGEVVAGPVGDTGTGHQVLRTHWRLDDPRSDFWIEIGLVLQEGSRLHQCNDRQEPCWATYPWWHEAVDDDLSQLVVARRENVSVFADGRGRGAIVRRLSFDLMRHLGGGGRAADGALLEKVQLWDGTVGYVRAEDVYALATDVRVTFRRVDGGAWKLATIIAGD